MLLWSTKQSRKANNWGSTYQSVWSNFELSKLDCQKEQRALTKSNLMTCFPISSLPFPCSKNLSSSYCKSAARIASLPTCSTPGQLMLQPNSVYQDWFSLDHVLFPTLLP